MTFRVVAMALLAVLGIIGKNPETRDGTGKPSSG